MASQAATHFLQFCIQYSSIALLYYDYTLTLPMEVELIWVKQIRLSTALYICCRYALVANVLYLLAISNKLTENCNIWYKFIGALSVTGRAAIIEVSFTVRTYAIFGQSRWILGYMGIIGLTCVILDIIHVPGLRCVGSSSIPVANDLLSILMVVFEYSTAILTFVRCVQAFRVSGSWKTQKKSFLYLIFEQGLSYFAIVSLFTTAAVVLNFATPAGFFQRLLNAFTLPLSCLLNARFLLHLRAWEKNRVVLSEAESAPQHATLQSFVAAPRPSDAGSSTGIISTAVDDFGQDLLFIARQEKVDLETGMSLQAEQNR